MSLLGVRNNFFLWHMLSMYLFVNSSKLSQPKRNSKPKDLYKSQGEAILVIGGGIAKTYFFLSRKGFKMCQGRILCQCSHRL